jgi:hypothetical protein
VFTQKLHFGRGGISREKAGLAQEKIIGSRPAIEASLPCEGQSNHQVQEKTKAGTLSPGFFGLGMESESGLLCSQVSDKRHFEHLIVVRLHH